jgi:hypothetical protein
LPAKFNESLEAPPDTADRHHKPKRSIKQKVTRSSIPSSMKKEESTIGKEEGKVTDRSILITNVSAQARQP